MFTRRIFLRGSAIAMAGMGQAPMWLARAAASEGTKRKTLVAIFMRGAADGLNIVAPFGDPQYRELRPILGLQPPRPQDENQNGPSGSPDPSRSHFDAQDYMESGTPGKTGDGWLNRALGDPGPDASALRAVALSNRVPRTLRGQREAVALGRVQDFNISDEERLAILRNMYSLTPDETMRRTGRDAFEAMKIVQSVAKQQISNGGTPAPPPGTPLIQQGNRVSYNAGGQLGQNLQELARLIKAGAGIEAAFAEVDGWDHHQNENNQLPNLLFQFSNAIAAFCRDLGDRMEDVVIVTMSEFGRTVAENGTGGTDHGHGSLMMVAGGPVKGGKIYGEWPGLEKEQLYEGRDLAVTTDFRTVLSEIVRGHLGRTDLSSVFPGFKAEKELGLLRA
jgi:uncharacterized protein (DUF1501 family)